MLEQPNKSKEDPEVTTLHWGDTAPWTIKVLPRHGTQCKTIQPPSEDELLQSLRVQLARVQLDNDRSSATFPWHSNNFITTNEIDRQSPTPTTNEIDRQSPTPLTQSLATRGAKQSVMNM